MVRRPQGESQPNHPAASGVGLDSPHAANVRAVKLDEIKKTARIDFDITTTTSS